MCVCVCVCVCVCPGPLCGDSWCGSDPGWKEASSLFHVSLPTISPGAIWVPRRVASEQWFPKKKKKKKREGDLFSRGRGLKKKKITLCWWNVLNQLLDCKDLVQFRKKQKSPNDFPSPPPVYPSIPSSISVSYHLFFPLLFQSFLNPPPPLSPNPPSDEMTISNPLVPLGEM